MKARRVSVAEAKDRLPALIHEAEESHAPVEITRRGKVVAVLVSSAEYAPRRKAKRSVVDEIRGIFQKYGVARGFTDEEVAALRARGPGRKVSFDGD
jgi:prevent-host-death family protein